MRKRFHHFFSDANTSEHTSIFIQSRLLIESGRDIMLVPKSALNYYKSTLSCQGVEAQVVATHGDRRFNLSSVPSSEREALWLTVQMQYKNMSVLIESLLKKLP